MKITAAMSVCVWMVTGAFAGPQPDAALPTVHFSEISRREVTVGDHKMTLIRVRPPALPKAPPPLPAPPAPTADQIATEQRMAQKAFASLNLTATVYLGKPTITELRWRDETGEKEFKAWSNIDFRYLTQLPYLETPTTVYLWFPIVDAYTLADFPAGEKPPIPKGLKLGGKGADYVVNLTAKDLAAQETTLAGLDYLHAYYQLNASALKSDYEKRLADASAEEIRLARNPPKKADTVTYFWPIQSSRNPR
jgi:hypothetical protein